MERFLGSLETSVFRLDHSARLVVTAQVPVIDISARYCSLIRSSILCSRGTLIIFDWKQLLTVTNDFEPGSSCKHLTSHRLGVLRLTPLTAGHEISRSKIWILITNRIIQFRRVCRIAVDGKCARSKIRRVSHMDLSPRFLGKREFSAQEEYNLQIIPCDTVGPRHRQPLQHRLLSVVPRINAGAPGVRGDDTHGGIRTRASFREGEIHPVGAMGVDFVPDATHLHGRVFVNERMRLAGKKSAAGFLSEPVPFKWAKRRRHLLCGCKIDSGYPLPVVREILWNYKQCTGYDVVGRSVIMVVLESFRTGLLEQGYERSLR